VLVILESVSFNFETSMLFRLSSFAAWLFMNSMSVFSVFISSRSFVFAELAVAMSCSWDLQRMNE